MSLAILASAVAARLEPRVSGAERAAARFAPVCRVAVARLCVEDRAFRDLATSFPALLHRIAVRPRDARAIEAAAIVLDGRELRYAAHVAGVAYWSRKLPPEAFGARSPDLPRGAPFGRSVANHLPKTRRAAPHWLACVAEATRWGEDCFTFWVARECASDPATFPANRIPLLALHAWYSLRPELAGGAISGGGWSSALGAKSALARAQNWLQAIELAVNIGARAVDPWLVSGEADGYEFEPLVSCADLLKEAAAMDNCLRTYGPYIAHDQERVFGVRRQGVRVATLSVEFTDGAPFPQIAQLKGPGNKPVAPDVWFAARRWVAAQAPRPPAEIPWEKAELDQSVWIEIWRPYWLAKRALPTELPLRPSRDAIRALEFGGPRRLARRRRRA